MRSDRHGTAIAALAAACFISVTSENAPIALLPVMSRDLHTAPAAIGAVLTGYALVVAATAIPAVSLTSSWNRRTAVVVAVLTITVANIAMAMSPNVGTVIAARSVAAIGHGVFWSVVAGVAARLSGPQRAGRATATVFAGNALAFVAGLPMTSALGSVLGWRVAVLVLALISAAGTGALLLALPSLPGRPGARRSADLRSVLRQPAVLVVTGATLVLVFGQFAAGTYLTELIRDYTGLHGSAVSLVLLAYGLLGVVGVLALRSVVDTRPRAAALTVTAVLALATVGLAILGDRSPPFALCALIAWAAPAAGIATVLQTGITRAARPGTADIASSGYVVAFQIGIGAGAWTGGVFIDRGAYAAPLLITAGCAGLAAIAIALVRTAFPYEAGVRP